MSYGQRRAMALKVTTSSESERRTRSPRAHGQRSVAAD
jgi:hypothetical protein